MTTCAQSTHVRRTPEPNEPLVREGRMEAEDIKFGLPVSNVHVARAGIFALAAGGIMPFQHEHQPFKLWAKCPTQ